MKKSVKNKIISLVMAGAMATAVGAVSASAAELSPSMLITNNAITAGIQNAESDLSQIHSFADSVKSGRTEDAQIELGTLMTTAKYRKSQLPFAGYSATYNPNDDILTQAYAVGQRQAENDTKAFHALKETGDLNQFAKSMGNNVGESLGAAKDIAKTDANKIMEVANALQAKYAKPGQGGMADKLTNHSYSASYLPQGSLLNFDNENAKLPNLFENTGIMQKVGSQIRPYSSTGYDKKALITSQPQKLNNGWTMVQIQDPNLKKDQISRVYIRNGKNGSKQFYIVSENGNRIGTKNHPVTQKKGQNVFSALMGYHK